MNVSAKEATRILVVDDEEAVRTLLRECFEFEGFLVSEARNGAELSASLSRYPADLITLDVRLGGEDGLEIARQVRAKNNIPIIMITGKGDPIDRVVGLELGADDYITKPFHVREVVARVRAVLRRYEAGASEVRAPEAGPAKGERFEFDDWVLDIGRRQLRSRTGEARELTTAEFNLLTIFLKRPSRVLSRDNIMDLLKGHDYSPIDRSIDALIVRLRKKIEPNPETPQIIKTVRGVGYVFAADVRRI